MLETEERNIRRACSFRFADGKTREIVEKTTEETSTDADEVENDTGKVAIGSVREQRLSRNRRAIVEPSDVAKEKGTICNIYPG